MSGKFLTMLLAANMFVFAQTKNDSQEDIFRQAKFHTLRLESSYGTVKLENFCTLDSIINSNLFKTKILKGNGFKNIQFIQVMFAEDEFFDNYINDNHNYNEDILYFEFILAYDKLNNKFYKIKGFLNNDFPIFYDFFIESLSAKPKKILRKKNSKSINYFLDNFNVEGLNFKLLLENFDDVNNWDIPYLRPSPSRLLIDEYGNYHIQ